MPDFPICLAVILQLVREMGLTKGMKMLTTFSFETGL